MLKVFDVRLTEILGDRHLDVLLPMPKDELEAKIKKALGEKEYFVDVIDKHGLNITEYTSIFALNDFAQFIYDSTIEESVLESITECGETELDTVKDVVENEKYCIIDTKITLEDEETCLGYALYENNLLDEELPEELVSKGYIDFNSIGRDYSIRYGWKETKHNTFCRTW